jgi:hypothetical protein
LFWPLATITSLYNIQATDEDILDLRNYAVKNFWYTQWVWNTFQRWTKCVVQWRNNKYQTKQCVFFRGSIGDDDMYKLLNKKYGLIVWYRGNSNYRVDSNDGVLDGISFQPTTYWHCTSLFLLNNKQTIVDSSSTHNRYTVPDITKVKNFFANYYVILPDKKIEGIDYIQSMMGNNSKERKKTWSRKYKNLLHTINNLCREYIE